MPLVAKHQPNGNDYLLIGYVTRGAAIASLFDRCSLTVSTCPPTPMEKFCHAARTHSLYRWATPRGFDQLPRCMDSESRISSRRTATQAFTV